MVQRLLKHKKTVMLKLSYNLISKLLWLGVNLHSSVLTKANILHK